MKLAHIPKTGKNLKVLEKNKSKFILAFTCVVEIKDGVVTPRLYIIRVNVGVAILKHGDQGGIQKKIKYLPAVVDWFPVRVVHQREFQKIKCVPAVVDWFISVGLTEVNVKFHDSDFITKSKFVNFSPSNKKMIFSMTRNMRSRKKR